METRDSLACLDLLPELPCPDHLCIHGKRLPTYSQVLLCYLRNLERLRLRAIYTNKKLKQTRSASKAVVEEMMKHHSKAGINTISHTKMREKIEGFDDEFNKARKVPQLQKQQVLYWLILRRNCQKPCHFGLQIL